MFARRVKTAAVALSLLYGGVVSGVALFYRTLLYPAPKTTREPILDGATVVKMGVGSPTNPADHDAPVFALYAPAPEGEPTLVHFHGNGEQLADEVALVRTLRDLGVGVLAVEYPGYGLAHGQSTSESAIYGAAERAIVYLDEKGVDKDSIVLVGFSLGSGVAAEMARRGHGARLVLLAPYTSIIDMVGHWVPIVPTSLLVGDRFDTLEKAASLTLPTFVVHGDSDPVIPVAMGRRVAAALPNASLEVVPGGHHNDLFLRDPLLASRLVDFARNVTAR